jgi:hypothetical protein
MSTLYFTCRDGDSVKTVWVQQQMVAPALQFALWASSGIGCESVMDGYCRVRHNTLWVWLGERGERKSEAVHFATVSLTLAHTHAPRHYQLPFQRRRRGGTASREALDHSTLGGGSFRWQQPRAAQGGCRSSLGPWRGWVVPCGVLDRQRVARVVSQW